MKVELDLVAGSDHRYHVTKEDIDKNIEAVERALERKYLSCDTNYLIDTLSILQAIRKQLP